MSLKEVREILATAGLGLLATPADPASEARMKRYGQPDGMPLIGSVVVRGEEIHPDCMVTGELMLTIIWKRRASDVDCPRCGKPLAREDEE